MKQFKFILLFIALSLMTIGALNAFPPNSPEYDAWKQEQIKPLSISEKAQLTVPAMGTMRDCPLLIPLDDTFTLAMQPNDDGYTSQLTLPFTFTLYDAPFTSCWVNNNGNVTFDEGLYSYTPWGFPSGNNPMLAPFFADVDTRGAGAVWYRIESNRMIVIWDHVGYFGSHYDKLNTFELIFSDGTDPFIGIGNNVAFSYADMAWTTGDASGGSQGFGGSAATVGINRGNNIDYAQIGRFDHAGLDYDGPFDNNDGVDWLDCKVFYFNTVTSEDAVLIIYPSTYPEVLAGIVPPTGVDPEDPDTDVFYAEYPAVGVMDVTYPVPEGIWRGWIYYGGAWHEADIFPVIGPNATVSFSDISFDGTSVIPFILVKEDDETLPVELSSFTAVQTAQNLAKITWVSQSETGLLGYNVYRNELNSPQSALMITPVLIGATNTSTTHTYSITDSEVEIGHTYWYWLESVDYGSSNFYGPVSILMEGDTPALVPGQTTMRNAYPNPFKAIGGTTIEVGVKENDGGSVTIYNVIGQEVISFPVTPGYNNINWNGQSSRGKVCPTGIYFYKLSTNSSNQTRKLLIIK